MRKLAIFLIVALSVIVGDSTALSQTQALSTSVFPDLTGPYKVGRVAYEWVDQSRDESYASIPGLKRDLMVNIWFPATPAKRAKIAPYMADSTMWAIVTKHPELENIVQPRAYTTPNVAPDKANYPVLIFEPDTTITIFAYSSIVEELASQGYIVVGMSHPYNSVAISYPDGRIVVENPRGTASPSSMDDLRVRTVLTQDIHFALDQVDNLNESDENFQGKIDLTRIEIIGHSYGGLIALLEATGDSRIKAGACLEMDPATIMTPPNKPFLYLGVGAAPRPNMQMKDTYWMYSDQIATGNFGDFPWLRPQIALPVNESFISNINPALGIQITNTYLLVFFNHYLNGADLKWPSYDETKLVAFPLAN